MAERVDAGEVVRLGGVRGGGVSLGVVFARERTHVLWLTAGISQFLESVLVKPWYVWGTFPHGLGG